MENSTRAVLISGASTGIGRHCALRLVRAGFKVFAGVRSEEAGEELKRLAPTGLKPLMFDITDKQSIDSAVDNLRSENLFGLVNNAGVALLGPLEFLPLDKIRQQFEVNLFGHIAVTQAFLPLLRKSGGRIVNMSSVSGLVAFPFAGAYASTKFALEAFSDSLRRELKPWNINVSLIEPGNINTPIWEKSAHMAGSTASDLPPEAATYYGKTLMGLGFKRNANKMGKPSAVAEALLRALTAKRPRARYVVAKDALFYSLLRRVLPDALLDRIISYRP